MSENNQHHSDEALAVVQETFKAVDQKLKTFDQKFEALDSYDKEKVEKAYAAVEKQDEANQKMVLELEEQKNQAKLAQERLENLEKELVFNSKNDVNKSYKESAEYKAYNELCMKWSTDLVDAQYKDYLRTDAGEFGGFLVPETMAAELLKEVTEVSPVRSLARVRSVKTKTLNIPIRTTLPTAAYEGEAEPAGATTSKYSSETMTAHRQQVIVPVTWDQLNFSNFDMQNEITQDAVLAFAQREGNRFILGTGIKQPQGIFDSSSNIERVETASSATFSLDDVIKLSGQLKQGYDGVYAFNKKTLATLRTETGDNGQYKWAFGGERFPTEINGMNYVIMQDIPDVSDTPVAGETPVLFGDFFRGYNILDSVQMELVRDDVTRKNEAIIEFSWNRYNDGRVVLAEAFKILEVKA